MTATNDPSGGPHPEDLLIPYALDNLADRDALQVESHLEDCSLCREEVGQFLQTTTLLSQAVERQTPPPALASRLMESLGRVEGSTASRPAVAPVQRKWFQLPKILVPAAAVAVVLVASLVANFWYLNQVGNLKEENSNLAARLVQFSTEDAKLMEFLQQEELASYLTANPSTEPLMLEPPGGVGDPQGVMLLGEDSRHAIVLVSGMAQGPAPTSYQVWLLRPGQRVRIGEVQVDASGSGAMSLFYPQESVLVFDRIVLSKDGTGSGETAARDSVLEGSFASIKTPQ